MFTSWVTVCKPEVVITIWNVIYNTIMCEARKNSDNLLKVKLLGGFVGVIWGKKALWDKNKAAEAMWGLRHWLVNKRSRASTPFIWTGKAIEPKMNRSNKRLFHKSHYIPENPVMGHGARELTLVISCKPWLLLVWTCRGPDSTVDTRHEKPWEEGKNKNSASLLGLPRTTLQHSSRSCCSPPHSLEKRKRWRRSRGRRLRVKLTDLAHLLLIRHRAALSSSRTYQEQDLAVSCFWRSLYQLHLLLVSLFGSSLMTSQQGQIQGECVKECERREEEEKGEKKQEVGEGLREDGERK